MICYLFSKAKNPLLIPHVAQRKAFLKLKTHGLSTIDYELVLKTLKHKAKHTFDFGHLTFDT